MKAKPKHNLKKNIVNKNKNQVKNGWWFPQ